ncbi:MAG: transcriptional repressor [Candidatus Obscuribacterales bacterium]|jgi:Fe2+ or Zn2+ uptake regulation protein
MIPAHQSAESVLLSHGVKPTPQRMVIAEYLLNTLDHPTAEEVMTAVTGKLPVALSRATVYNTLNSLKDAGVIREVFTEPGKVRYDANLFNHHHFVDVKTGQILDVPVEKVEQLGNLLDKKFKVHGVQVTFYGDLQQDED